MTEEPVASHDRTLTFGDDGTPNADIAWLFIASHQWPGWKAEILTVEQPEDFGPIPDEERTPHPWQPPRHRSPERSTQFSSITHLIAKGDPRLVLSRSTDLLVVGPRGPGLMKALHLGSTSEWLLVHPPAPLLIARHGHNVQNALVCADGSAHSIRAIELLATLPWLANVDVTVLCVKDRRVEVDEAIGHAAALLRPAARTVTANVESGAPSNEIMNHLANNPADLVVLGTRGLTGIRHLRLGSTASAVAHASSCSVLVACDEEALLPVE